MHRQSLGSPASKLQSHGVLFADAGVIHTVTDNNNLISEFHQKNKLAASSTNDEESKSQKSQQQKLVPVSSSTRLIHLIPILLFFCFLVLYLSSHDPSGKDLARFSGFDFQTRSSMQIAVDDNVGGRSMAIRSTRNLQQQEWIRLHRKFRH